jgi:hypothetical protein
MSEHQTGSGQPPPSVMDEAIDRAVREMVAIDPPAGLRRRVLARLTTPVVSRSSHFRGYMAAAAVLAMVVLVVGVMRRDNGVSRTQNVAVPAQADVSTLAAPSAQSASTASSALRDEVRRATPAEPAPPELDAVRSAPEVAAYDSRQRQTAPARPAPLAEEIRMPPIVNLFGATGNMVSGTSIAERVDMAGTDAVGAAGGRAGAVSAGSMVADAARAPMAKTVAAKPIEIQLLSIAPLEIDPIRISEISAARKR